ncbi:MAG: hypothetical protein AAB562_03120 [Patescibacteria group bacterium]
MDCERLEKRSVVMGFAIAFATCGLTLLGSMRGVSDPNELFGTVWWTAYGWFGLTYLAMNAVFHSALIARTGKVGWAFLHLLFASPWALVQMLAATIAPLFLMFKLGFGAPVAIGANLALAALAFAYCYRLTRTSPAATVRILDADWAAIEAEADVDRILNPETDLRARFAALERPKS